MSQALIHFKGHFRDSFLPSFIFWIKFEKIANYVMLALNMIIYK